MRTLLSGLQTETYVLDVDTNGVDLSTEHGWRMRDECSIEIDVPKGDVLNDVFSKLKLEGINVTSMRNKTNRLEQLFMGLVDNTVAEEGK
jgi:ABC-2 type transport system ATP-binding protein